MMNADAWAGQITAPLAIIVGGFLCFWGYRILKLSLGIVGFVLGAGAGWQAGLLVAHGNNALAVVAALVGGLIGAGLCLWLFYLGIFLLGASAGAVIATAFFSTSGNQAQPLLLLGLSVGFGILALVLQKFMIVLCTAFSGAYLLVAGGYQLLAGAAQAPPLGLGPGQPGRTGSLVAWVLWLVLALVGVGFQFRSRRRREVKVQPAPQAA